MLRSAVIASAAGAALLGCGVERTVYRDVPAYYAQAGVTPGAFTLEDGTRVVYRIRETPGAAPAAAAPEAEADGDGGSGGAPRDTPERPNLLPRDVLSDLLICLRDEEYERLYREVLAAETREAYEAEGGGLEGFTDFCRRHRDDLYAAMTRLGAGLDTPQTITEYAGTRVRVAFHPHFAKAFRFTTLEMVRDPEGLKLLMIR